MPFETRSLQPFGVELIGDLSEPLADRESAQFRDLLFEQGLIVARGQKLPREAHVRIGGYIGRVITSGDLQSLSNTAPDDPFKDIPLAFHSDNFYSPDPHVALSLHALDVTPDSTATRFANACRAVAALPPGLRRRLEDKQVRISFADHCDGANWRREELLVPECNWPRRHWPVIGKHPVTGREFIAANYNGTDRIAGMDRDDYVALLEELFAVLYAPENILEHQWRNGDVIFWDNYAVQHGRARVPAGIRRVLGRCAVGGTGFADMHPDVVAYQKSVELNAG